MNWQQIELMGYAYYAERGYRILVSLVRTDGYDFVAEKDGLFVRVNVKTAGLKDKSQPESWSVAQASGGHTGYHENNQVDTYLAWLPHQQRFIELDGDFLHGGNSKSKRIPKEFLM